MKNNSWLGVVGAIALLLVVVGCGNSGQSREEAIAEARREAYEDGYQDGKEAGQEMMMEILWDEGIDAFSNIWVDFCCPNPYCQAYINFSLGDGPYIEAYRGYDGWEDYTDSYYIEVEYKYH